jgi:hypothetical protein
MTTAKEILRLIETVDPSDRERMDEIDARVEVYLKKGGHFSHWREGSVLTVCFTGEQPNSICGEYTRSRDALKSTRPEGWSMHVQNLGGENFYVELSLEDFRTTEKHRPTEELAELHAIIQAIEYERGTDGK